LIKRCEICNAEKDLQIHHISYDPEITIVVCIKCHSKLHPTHGVGRPIGKGKSGHNLRSQLQKFKELYERGASLYEIQKELKISHVTAYKYKRILGLKKPLKHKNGEGYALIRVRIQTFEELEKIKVKEGHTSFDSVIKSLLRNHRELKAIRRSEEK